MNVVPIVLAFVVVGLSASSASAASPAVIDTVSPALSARLTHIGQDALAKEHVPGIAIGIVRGSRVVYARGFGDRYVSSHTRVDAGTRFSIGSNSKQFVAAAIMLLVDDKKMTLDDPVSTWFPDFPRAAQMTVRQLLTHESGMADYTQAPQFYSQVVLPGSAERILALVKTLPPVFAPGTRWEYSNSDYVMAARIVELISGEPLATFLKARVFDPLGMHDTGFFPFDDGMSPDVAVGYTSFAFGDYHRSAVYDRNWVFGAGDIGSTIADLTKWNAAIDGGTLLSASSTAVMHAPSILPDGKNTGYGLGLEVGRLPSGRRYVKHGGALPGFITEDARYPDDHLAIIVLANSDQFVMGPVVSALYAALTSTSTVARGASRAPELVASAAPNDHAAIDGQVERWLRSAIAGSVDRTFLRVDLDQKFDSGRVRDIAGLRRFGDLKAFTFNHMLRRQPITSYYYVATFAHKKCIVLAEIDDSGKMSNITVANGDPIG